MFELAIHRQVPGRYFAGNRMPEDATAMGRQVIECRRRPVRPEIVGRRAHDHLDRKELPTDHPLAGRGAEPETDIDAIQHPVADTIIELDVGLDTRMRSTKLVKQRHEDGDERGFRPNDAQRTCDL